jgi:hypothetical protein
MDAFEQLVATILDREGYWVRTSVKVKLTPEEKREIGRPSAPRWELDIVAYSGRKNELLVVECKSYLDSPGVRLTSFDGPKVDEETRYKLFNDDVLRRIVLHRLEMDLAEQGFCPEGTKATLCLAAGRIYGDPSPLHDFFQKKDWRLLDREWLVVGLRKLADESYENSVAAEAVDGNSSAEPERAADKSTQPGYTNSNGQTVLRATGRPGTDHGQFVHELQCGECDETYGANGSDIWLRKCPKCQGGRPGLAVE